MKIAVLGCGNMASALVKGMHQASDSFEFYTYTPSKTRAKNLANLIEGAFCSELSEIPEVDLYMIACKPQQFESLAHDLKIKADANVLSIMAGITCEKLSEKLGTENILRVMPNTPCLVGKGVCTFYFSKGFKEELKKEIVSSFEKFSTNFILDDEEMIEKTTPYSGSGPAYIFEMARIIEENLVKTGLDTESSKKMVGELFRGASEMLAESKESYETLRNNVTSKGGVTYEALETFKESDLDKIFERALTRAYDRAKELAEGK